MQLQVKQMDALRSVDIAAVDKNELADVSTMQLDPGLSREERAARILRHIKNPYCFRCGDVGVKVEFADGGPNLQDVMTSYLVRQKSGL